MRLLSPRQRIRIALRLWMPVLVLRIVVVQPLVTYPDVLWSHVVMCEEGLAHLCLAEREIESVCELDLRK